MSVYGFFLFLSSRQHHPPPMPMTSPDNQTNDHANPTPLPCPLLHPVNIGLQGFFTLDNTGGTPAQPAHNTFTMGANGQAKGSCTPSYPHTPLHPVNVGLQGFFTCDNSGGTPAQPAHNASTTGADSQAKGLCTPLYPHTPLHAL